MNKELFVVYYKDKDMGNTQTHLVVSEIDKVRERVQRLIQRGDINTDQENPAILNYPYIGGYKVEILSDKLEKIIAQLLKKRENMYNSNPDREFKSYFGYLEALRDVLMEARRDWIQEDRKDILNDRRTPRDEARDKLEEYEQETRITFTTNSNIPGGYNVNGDRI